jgi:hypothetical protein
MKVQCPCGKEYEVSEQLIGKSVKCSVCSKNFVIPAPNAPRRQATVQATAPLGPPQQVVSRGPVEPAAIPVDRQATQWVAQSVAASNERERAEREQQLIAQYTPYTPKPGERIRVTRKRPSSGSKVVGLTCVLGGIVVAVVGVVLALVLPLSTTIKFTIGGAIIGAGVAILVSGLLMLSGIIKKRKKKK